MHPDRLIDGQLHFIHLFIAVSLLDSTRALPRTDPAVNPDHPFLFMWNAPTELCNRKFGIRLNLSYFHIVSSTLDTQTNQIITIFYSYRFGVFPYIDEKNKEKKHNGGLPQLINFTEHHEKAKANITYYIPENQPGLAILDFEEWRPQWIRNWGSKDIYREFSIDIVKKENQTLSDREAKARAKLVFERAAKKWFIESLHIGKRLRPKRLWGYYLYPECYNHEYNQNMTNYDGACPEREIDRNNKLLWLWNESTALFPSIYLEVKLRDSKQARLYVRHRIQEAMRVSMLPSNGSYAIPVYPYIRPVYKNSVDDYMSEGDLVSTIGEAAALGAAGVVSWGDMHVTKSKNTCTDAQRHLEEIMNPYILNVTMATQLCSEALCQAKGRCVRKPYSDDYLHLDPRRYQIQKSRSSGKLTVTGGLSQDDVDWFQQRFHCMCYTKEPCQFPKSLNTNHSAVLQPSVVTVLLLLLAAVFLI